MSHENIVEVNAGAKCYMWCLVENFFKNWYLHWAQWKIAKRILYSMYSYKNWYLHSAQWKIAKRILYSMYSYMTESRAELNQRFKLRLTRGSACTNSRSRSDTRSRRRTNCAGARSGRRVRSARRRPPRRAPAARTTRTSVAEPSCRRARRLRHRYTRRTHSSRLQI